MQDAIPSLARVAVPDEVLAKGLVAGDPDAFAAFYDFFLPRVWRFALRRSSDRDAAERLTEAILETVVALLPQCPPDGNLASLVFAVARRVAQGGKNG
jgi:DNA-directed RNA polymerase specialized sigma24 family protein